MASSQTLHPASFLKRKKVPCQLKKRKDLHSSWLTHWMCWRVKTLWSSWWLCVGKDWPISWTGLLTTTRLLPILTVVLEEEGGEPWLHHLQESPSLQRQAANVYEAFSFSPTSSHEEDTWTNTIYQTVTSLWTSTMSPNTT